MSTKTPHQPDDPAISASAPGDVLPQIESLLTQIEHRCTWLALTLPDDVRRDLEGEVAALSTQLATLVCTARQGGQRIVLVLPQLNQ